MAHFAELKSKVDPTGFTTDTHQVVERVVVVGNDIPANGGTLGCLLYTSPSPRDVEESRMPSSA